MVMRITSRYNSLKHQPLVNITDEDYDTWLAHSTNGLDIRDKETRQYFQEELPTLSDLLGMEADDIDTIKSTMSTQTRNSRGHVNGATHLLSTRTCLRLKALIKVFEYHSLVQRNISMNEITWPHVLAFMDEWKALEKLTKVDPPAVPKFNHQKGMAKHMQSLLDFFRRVYGCQMTTLSYLICSDDIRDDSGPDDAEPFVPGRFHCASHSRIVDELHARVSRHTAAAGADNELLFKLIAESLAGTSAETALDEFLHTRDGVGLWHRLIDTQSTDVQNEAIAKGHLKYLQTSNWIGAGSGQLYAHVEKHRRNYEAYGKSAERARMQLYTDRTRVQWLLDSLAKCEDTNVKIRANFIRDNDDYLDNFEKAAVYLAKSEYKDKNKKRKNVSFRDDDAEVGAIQGGGRNGNDKKQKGLGAKAYQSQLDFNGGRGKKTGVELRWYDKKEYRLLKKAERLELNKWRATNGITRKSEAEKKEAQKTTNTLKSAIGKIAALITKHAPAAQEEMDSIVAGVEASVGSITVDPPATSGEAQADAGHAEVGDVARDVDDKEGSPVEEVDEVIEQEIERQVEISAAVGLQTILKKKKDTSSRQD